MLTHGAKLPATAHGQEPKPHGGSYGYLYLDIYPPTLQLAERPHVPTTQLLRPGNFATAGDERLPDWLSAPSSNPLVYVTLGTVFSNDAVLSTIVQAIRMLPVRVVVTVGPKGDPASLGPQPENVHVSRYIPQDQILRRCAAVVSHAGSGTFLAALAAGLPQLCVPQAADQFLNAAACTRSGTGLALQSGSVSIDEVRSDVERLLSEATFRTAAEHVKCEIAAMPSPQDVATGLHTEYR
ncbi:MAG: glycosyltransferase [Acidimicrobiales bacterium]